MVFCFFWLNIKTKHNLPFNAICIYPRNLMCYNILLLLLTYQLICLHQYARTMTTVGVDFRDANGKDLILMTIYWQGRERKKKQTTNKNPNLLPKWEKRLICQFINHLTLFSIVLLKFGWNANVQKCCHRLILSICYVNVCQTARCIFCEWMSENLWPTFTCHQFAL